MRTLRTMPPSARSVHFIGDPHVPVTNVARLQQVVNDLSRGVVPDPAVRIILGDLSNENGSDVNDAGGDATAVAWAGSLPGDAAWYTLVGNHDIYNNNRTAAAAAAAFGQASLNQNIDLGFCRLILVNPDTLYGYPSDPLGIYLTQETIDWMEDQLDAAGSTPCLICCHAPLYNTCVDTDADDAVIYDSQTVGFYVRREGDALGDRDIAIRTAIGNHSNAIAWVSGHTHMSPRRAGSSLFTLTTCGARQVAAIQVPAVYYTTPSVAAADPLWSVFVTVRDDGNLECRLRNHATGTWDISGDQDRVVVLEPT